MADVNNAAELRKLADLRDRGVLTESEYHAQEDKILRQPPMPPPSHTSDDEPSRRRRRMAERDNFTAVLALLCAFVFWPAGIILGYQARREARRTGDGDDRLALIALSIGYIAAVLTIIVIVVDAYQ